MRIDLLCLLLVFSLPLFTANAGVYRWVDADGSVVYGDNPPKKSGAKSVDLPILTVADGYAPQQPGTTPAAVTPATPPEKENTPAAYSDFKITAPAANEAIRANDGNLSVNISLTPELKNGDGITLYLDSKQVATGAALAFPLTGMERGEHTVFAVLNDAKGNIIQNTETVKFNVLRNVVAKTP